MAIPNLTTLLTLSLSLVFAAIWVYGARFAFHSSHSGHLRFHSVAAGIAVSYTFLHVLPVLGRMNDVTDVSISGFKKLFPEYSPYLWAMAGFMVFYGLEKLVARSPLGPENNVQDEDQEKHWRRWVHIGGFAVYAWLMTYLMTWTGKGPMTLGVYGLAMGTHIYPIACNLSGKHRAVYDRRGAYVLALAALAGWVAGLSVDLTKPVMVNLVAIVGGGVIINTAITELPKEREGRFDSFVAGAAFNTALLLILSHFEHGDGA